ncbi:MAG TPA: MarR family transcriptional regulator [Candidatus Limnocylindrales bacterium]|nr:MarR family transcriptional regulator [Candidatus Limnocylindrales bacterium]
MTRTNSEPKSVAATRASTAGAPTPPPLDPLIETIVADVQSAWCRMRTGASERLLRDGVSMAHMHLLWLLADQGPMPMTRIAESLDISLSNASGFIDRMEERGLVERERVPDDRRLVVVRVAPAGQDAMEALELLRRDHMARILGRLSPTQLARVQAALIDIRAAYASEREAR